MSRSNLFFKVEVEHDSGENPQRIGDEIRRHLKKLYGVLEVELSNITAEEDEIQRLEKTVRRSDGRNSRTEDGYFADRGLEGAAEKRVRHAGDVIADHAMDRLRDAPVRRKTRAGDRVPAEELKQLRHHRHRPRAILGERSRIVDRAIQKLLESAAGPGGLAERRRRASAGTARTSSASRTPLSRARAAVPSISPETSRSTSWRSPSWNRSRAVAAGIASPWPRGWRHIPERRQPRLRSKTSRRRIRRRDRRCCMPPHRRDRSTALQRRPQGGQITVQFRLPARNQIVRMLDHPFAHFESEVQAGKRAYRCSKLSTIRRACRL
jgi:hypothetical protein